LTSRSEQSRRAPTFNLSVDQDPNYFVGESGLWVHNCSKCGAENLVQWVDEAGDLRENRRGMSNHAYEYQSSAPGARSNYQTGRSQAPYLSFVNEAGETVGAKFDGAFGSELIDRKINPTFSPKAVNQAQRQAAVGAHHGLDVVWELPDEKAVKAANRFMEANKITGIKVRLKERE
jgi:filamentous hemagglutinin